MGKRFHERGQDLSAIQLVTHITHGRGREEQDVEVVDVDVIYDRHGAMVITA